MSFWNKLKFWKRREDRKTGALRGILKCLVPCVRQRSSLDSSRSEKEEINLEHSKETSFRCPGTQYKAVIEAERRQELLDIRKMIRNAKTRNLPMELPHSTQLGGNFYGNTEQDCQGRIFLGDYQLLERLGQGAFGQVVLAKKKAAVGRSSKEELFAVKIVPHLLISKVEKEVLIRAVGHPFLIQLVSYFETQVAACYVMEYMEGGTLDSQLCTMGRFPESVARFYAAEIILAVSFLHKCGIVHRDIKPTNILFARDGHCKLADFGTSQVGIFDEKYMVTKCGTEPYMAPEVMYSSHYGCEVDWWSVGLIMYEMMLGRYSGAVFDHPAQYPQYLTGHAVSILKMFLTSDPRRRLGAGGDTRSILKHPFFKKVDWDAVLQKRVTPPFKPEVIEVVTGDSETPGTADDSGRRVVLKPDATVEPHSLVETEAPVALDAPEDADAPAEVESPVEPDALVVPGSTGETEAPMEPGTLVESEAPVALDAPEEADAPVAPGSPVETETPVEADTPVEPEAPVAADTLVAPGSTGEMEAPMEPGTLVESEAPVALDAPEEADAPVAPGSPVETETPVEADTPVEPEAPVAADTLVAPGSTGEMEAPMEPGTLVESEAPVALDAPEEADAPVAPGSPVETETPVEPGTPVEPEALVEVGAPVEADALVEPNAPVEPDSPEEIEAPMELDAILEHVEREISSLKEDAEQLRKLQKEKERERICPPLSTWQKIKCVAGGVFIGLVAVVLAVGAWEMTYTETADWEMCFRSEW